MFVKTGQHIVYRSVSYQYAVKEEQSRCEKNVKRSASLITAGLELPVLLNAGFGALSLLTDKHTRIYAPISFARAKY